MFHQRTYLLFVSYLLLGVVTLLLGMLWLLRPATAVRAQALPEALGTLGGVVRNAEGDPLPNITVWLEHYTQQLNSRMVKTNSTGAYHFPSVFSGNYRLRFEDQAGVYAPAYYEDADFAEDAATITVNGNNVSGVNMELDRAGAISLTVTSTQGFTMTSYAVYLYRQNANGRWATYRTIFPPVGEPGVLISGLPAGNYRMCLYSSGGDFALPDYECYDNVLAETVLTLPPNASDIHVQPGAETAVNIVLSDISQIQGYLRDPANQPLAGLMVRLQSQTDFYDFSAFTDEKGYFRFGHIPKGLYYLIFNSREFYNNNEYLPIYYPNGVTVEQAESIIVDPTTRISVTLNLIPEARITGTISVEDGLAPNWVYMFVYRQAMNGQWYQPGCFDRCPSFDYDPLTGVYTVTQLLHGRYRIGAETFLPTSNRYLQAYYGGSTLEEATDIVVATGESKGNINITLGKGQFESAIAGTVTAGGAPRQGIEVGLFSEYYSTYPAMPVFTTTTDAQGRYMLAGLPLGDYQVGFRDPQGIFATTFYSDGSSLFSPTSITITQTGTVDGINVDLSPGGTIRGHIRTQHGQAASDFRLTVWPEVDPLFEPLLPLPYIDVRSDASGFFEITGLPPDRYYLRAETPLDSADFPFFIGKYHVGAFDLFGATVLTVEAGQTLEGKDIFFFTTPTNFIPVVHGNAEAAPPPGFGEPIPIPAPGLPAPPAAASRAFP